MSFPCFFTRLCAFLSSCTEQGLMGVLQRTIDGVSVWCVGHSQPAGPTAYTIRSSVFGRLWGHRWTEKWAGVKNMWPYKYQSQNGLVHFFPILPTHPIFLSVSLSPTVGISLPFVQYLRPWSYQEPDSSLRDITLYPDWFRRTLNTASFFFQSFIWFLATKLYPGSLQCSVLFWGFYFLLVAILPCH